MPQGSQEILTEGLWTWITQSWWVTAERTNCTAYGEYMEAEAVVWTVLLRILIPKRGEKMAG